MPLRHCPGRTGGRVSWRRLRSGSVPAFLAGIVLAALLAVALPRILPPLLIAGRLIDDVLLTRLAPREPQNQDIVIIGISEATLAGLACRSPIDRGFLRDLVDRLETAGVRAIGIDILFDLPTVPALDAALHGRLRQAKIPVVTISAHDATPLTTAQRQYLESFLDGLNHGYANLTKDWLDNTARWHEPWLDRAMSFPARLAAALGVRVPRAPFEIVWHGQPDDATGPFPVYPAEAVALLPPAWLAGRIALIGVTLADTDRHRTPLAVLGRSTAGVEIQAHVLAQLLDGRQHPRVAPWAELLLALGLAGLGGLVGAARIPVALAALAGLSGLLAHAGIGVAAVMQAGPLLPLLSGSLAWLGGIGTATGLSLWRERQERQTLMRLFSRHVSAPLAEEIWRERATFMAGGRPKPLELTATVLFSDIAGFTGVAERLGPVALMAWLERYLDHMVAIVAEERGLVLRFIGDAMLAVYGVPVARTREAEIAADARAAVRSALAMARAVTALNAELAADGMPPIGIRIGIHTGPLVVGSLGGAAHVEYALVGDTANTAARLESLGKTLRGPGSGPATIVLSEATRARLDEGFALREMGEMALKGKEQSVRIYELLDRAVPANPAAVMAAGRG